MKFIRFFLLASLVSLLFIGGFYESTYAKGKGLPEAPSSGVPADKNGYGGPVESIGINATNYLKSWGSSILEISDSTVKVSGTTTTYTSVDEISVSLYLQIWDASNGIWKDYVYLGGNSYSNQYEISDSVSAVVPKGYYYRAKANHSASSGSSSENATSFSKYIYID